MIMQTGIFLAENAIDRRVEIGALVVRGSYDCE
jgi:hypothetical protein